MTKSKYSISVVFAAYNEEESVEATIKRSIESLEKQFDNFEIILVNDASTDTTPAIINRLATGDPRIRVLHNEKNLRQGHSLLKGFAIARNDLIIHNGIDYPFDLDDLALMLPLMDEADVVVATRQARSGYSAYRKFLSRGNIFLIHTLFDLRLPDYNFTQLYKREVIQNMRIRAKSTGFVAPELIIRAHQQGYRVAQVEIKYLPRETGVARSGTLRVIRESFTDMICFWLETNKLTAWAFNDSKT